MERSPILPTRNILDRRRELTDVPFLFVAIFFTFFWIIIVMYACIGGSSTSSAFPFDLWNVKIKSFFDIWRILVIIGFTLLAGSYTLSLFQAMRWIPNFSYTTVITVWITLITNVVVCIVYMNFPNGVTLFGSLVSFILIHVLVHTEWFHLPEAILKESCKVIILLPSTIVFSTICYLLCTAVITLTLTAHHYMDTPAMYTGWFKVINIISGSWIFGMILYLQQAVLSATFAVWFWIPCKEDVNFRTLLRCLKITLKYHIGTAAYGTSFGPIVNFVMLLIRAIMKLTRGCSNTVRFFIVYNIFDAILLRFLSAGSIVKCATHGKSYYQSIKDTYEWFEAHPRRCLLVTKVMEYLLLFIVIIMSLLMTISLYGYIKYLPEPNTTNYNWRLIFAVPIIFGTLLFLTPMMTTLIAAYNTIFFCFLEDVDSESETHAMSSELQAAIVHDGPTNWYRKCLTCCGTIPYEHMENEV